PGPGVAWRRAAVGGHSDPARWAVTFAGKVPFELAEQGSRGAQLLRGDRGELAWIQTTELAPGGRHANRFVTVFWVTAGGLSCSAVALSGEVHDGRGAKLLRGYRPGPARGPAVRRRGPLHREGRRGQEPAQVGQLLRLPGRLCPAAADWRKDTPGPDRPS